MHSFKRREDIMSVLQARSTPVSATSLAGKFGVSRQIIVGDIALIRAAGTDVLSTPKGYILPHTAENGYLVKTVACRHTEEKTIEELYTIVDNGCGVLEVIVEHPLYGQLCGELHVFSRHDADKFIEKVKYNKIGLLSGLTSGIHLHTIRCKTEEDFLKMKAKLKEQGFLFEEQDNI